MVRSRRVSKAARPEMPKKIFAQASPRSIGPVSMFDAQASINAGTAANFQSESQVIDSAVSHLRQAGFEILQISSMSINIAGSQETYENAFRSKLYIKQYPVIKPGAVEDIAEFIECSDAPLLGLISTTGTPFENELEGVAIEEPRYYMAPSIFPPLKAYWHLDVPAGVSLALNADKPHRGAITGRGIRVAMVDSGHYSHPFFSARGYRVAPVILGPGATNPLKDEVGHGTGESANIFAIAPDVELLPIKMSFVNTIGAFNAAVALQPDIITCSWGSSIRLGPLSAANQALAAAVSAAWAAGIVVIFSAGNGHWGFPAQHPDCIAAGGVFMDANESLRASDYASGFMSNIYSGRRVPDVCGLVGMKPKAIYIMLPLEPNDDIDQGNAGSVHPQGDETASNDGWAAFSGTSAAAPQLAGLAALIKQACSKLTPAEIRDVMRTTARDVTQGNCNTSTGGHPATIGPDTATGDGLADARKAVMLAKVKCLVLRGPVSPTRGIEPRSIEPSPIEPRTIEPIRPVLREPSPIQPRPVPPQPRPAPAPIQPRKPLGGAAPSLEEVSLESQVGALSDEDIQSLEEMIIKSQLELE